MDHVFVTTERLRLRHPRSDDAEALASIFVDPEVMIHLNGPRDLTEMLHDIREEAAADPNPTDLWPLELLATGELVGYCGVVPKEVDGVTEHEVIYILARSAWGNGYATEAASGIIDYAFSTLDLDHVISMIHVDNDASARVAERCGMTHERNTVRPGGKQLRVFVRHRRTS
ncbi:MAG: GNAT family N-acetyltransferase [Acidimicrobiia bacterium]|nr:GNAT family N-acetyltransferase [Acidimicrobiia bacterium]